MVTEQQKKKEAAPLEEILAETKKKMMFLLQIKEAKIPFYDKLPKDHQFYKHFMASINTKKMTRAAQEKMNDDRNLFEDAGMKIMR